MLVGILAAATSCGDGAGPIGSRAGIAGLYVLATVNGDAVPTSDPSAPINGSLYLWPTGHAERHVTYRTYTGGTEVVESEGTFHLDNGAIVFDLRPKGDVSPNFWRVTATFDNRRISFGYPGPADGWMAEEYRRK